jgi:hypothetical protein
VRQLVTGHTASLRLSPLAGRGRIASAIRVRGSFREGGGNRFENARQIARDVVVPKSQDAVVTVDQPSVANNIPLTVSMLSSVYLDDQAAFAANEIYCVRADWLLPDELVTVQPASSEAIPERSLRVRQRASQVSCALRLALISTSHAEAPPHPSCFARRPLPASGERRKVQHT